VNGWLAKGSNDDRGDEDMMTSKYERCDVLVVLGGWSRYASQGFAGDVVGRGEDGPLNIAFR
jgi:hypothetical protein